MAYAFFDIVTTTGAWTIYELKTLLVAQGWTVLDSGDGLALYGGGSDVIASGDSGAGGLANTGAWFRITSPDAVVEFTVQRGANNWSYRIKYSRSGKFIGAPTGGGATDSNTTPSAADEQVLVGGGTDAAPTYTTILYTTDGYIVYKAGADDAAPYTFYLVGTTPGGDSGAVRSAWVFDSCVQMAPGDAESYAHYISTSNALLLATLYSIATGPFSYYPALAPATWQRYACVQYTQNVTNASVPGNVPTNPITKKDLGLPIWLARRTADPNPGYKGKLTMMRWRGFQRTNGTTFKVTTSRDRIGFGDVVFPWGGTVTVN